MGFDVLVSNFRGLIVISDSIKVTSWTNPIILVVQTNPIVGISVLAMLGNTSPPTVLPQAATAMARALLLVK